MAETISDISSGTNTPAEQEGAVFVRTREEGTTEFTRSLTTTKAVQDTIIEALKKMGIRLDQPNDDAKPTKLTGDTDAIQILSVQNASTNGIPDRLQVKPPLSPEQITQVGASVGNLARLYAYTEGPEPELVNPTTIQPQASTEQIAA